MSREIFIVLCQIEEVLFPLQMVEDGLKFLMENEKEITVFI